MSAETPPKDKAHCNSCGQETNHYIISSHEKKNTIRLDKYDPDSVIVFSDTYEILECCGCETLAVRRKSWFSETPDGIGVDYYPPAISRRIPSWSECLPDNELGLLEEVYTALHAGSRRLAMMGARALIDVVLANKVNDQGSFTKTLAEGESQGYVSKMNCKILATAFDAGSAAAHRGYNASITEVNQVIDIVESLLQNVYVLDSLADNLKKKTPPRKTKAKKK